MKKIECTCTDECLGYLTQNCKGIDEPKQEPFKHKVESLPAEEVLANRSNAYKFIDFDKPNIIDVWLDKNGNPEIAKQVEEDKRLFSEEDMVKFAYDYMEEKRDKGARAFTPQELIKRLKNK